MLNLKKIECLSCENIDELKFELFSSCIVSLDIQGKFIVYDIIQNEILISADGVKDFARVDSILFNRNALATIDTSNTVKIYLFEEFKPNDLDFDESKVICRYNIEKISENFFLIAQFQHEATKLIYSYSNSIAMLNRDSISLFCLYSDGIYKHSEIESKDCHMFVGSDTVTLGASVNHFYVFDKHYEVIFEKELNVKKIINSEGKTFGIICDTDAAYIYNVDTNSLVDFSCTCATNYLRLKGNDVIKLPDDYQVLLTQDHLPIFIDSKGNISTFDDDSSIYQCVNSLKNIGILLLTSSTTPGLLGRFLNILIKKNDFSVFIDIASVSPPNALLDILKDIDKKLNDNFASLPSEEKRFFQCIMHQISIFCVERIRDNVMPDEYSSLLSNLRDIILTKQQQHISQDITEVENPRIKKEELLNIILNAVESNNITSIIKPLRESFPEYEPINLIKTMTVQKSWELVCHSKVDQALTLLSYITTDPFDVLKRMWRFTTRNQTRLYLYKFLIQYNKLNSTEKSNFDILRDIVKRFPNTSFRSAAKLSASPVINSFIRNPSQLQWPINTDVLDDYNDSKSLIFPELFNIPDEPIEESPNYFVGNIHLIESQDEEVLKLLRYDCQPIDKLWLLHCKHNIDEMKSAFLNELQKNKLNNRLKCLDFVNKYHQQMNIYELETLLDVLCDFGRFADFERNDFDKQLIRICKNKYLFDHKWWENIPRQEFEDFFRRFAEYCSTKCLFMPFEMFVISHPETRSIDLSNSQQPLIRFIWSLWIERDPEKATLSCLQYITDTNTTDMIELWKKLPPESLAPLASYVYSPSMFEEKPELKEYLCERLNKTYPVLARVVGGGNKHTNINNLQQPESKWRSPIFTSRFDLEVHDLIQQNFDYDFSKVFTNYYGNTPGQPNYPHFDHPELVRGPTEKPYSQYIMSMLPVSAFQQIVEDGKSEDEILNIIKTCVVESFEKTKSQLAVLTFINLFDLKYSKDYSLQYKLCIALYNKLFNIENINDKLISIFLNSDSVIAADLIKNISPSNIEDFLLCCLLNVRCNLELSYTPFIYFSKNMLTAELLLFLDKSSEYGASYEMSKVISIVERHMPSNGKSIKEHLIFHLKQSSSSQSSITSNDVPHALVVYRAITRTDVPQMVSLLQEALTRKNTLYSVLATTIPDADLGLCTLVSLILISERNIDLDLLSPPPLDERFEIFYGIALELFESNKSLELLKSLSIFAEDSILLSIVQFYRSIEISSYRNAEAAAVKLKNVMNGSDEDVYEDVLFTQKIQIIKEKFGVLLEKLLTLCANKSKLHVFRYLQILDSLPVSENLVKLVSLTREISKFPNFRQAIACTDILGSPEKVVSDLVMHHSIQLGKIASEILGTSSEAATKQWLIFQYSTASSPEQLLDIHKKFVKEVQTIDKNFFIFVYALTLPYVQPTFASEIIRFVSNLFNDPTQKLSKNINALKLFLSICTENSIEVEKIEGEEPELESIINLLFPDIAFGEISPVKLNFTVPRVFSMQALTAFFDTAVEKVVDVCIDSERLDDAKLICNWRSKDLTNIDLLEGIQIMLGGGSLTDNQIQLLEKYDTDLNVENIIEKLANERKWKFKLFSLYYQASKKLGLPFTSLLNHKANEFLDSPLSITIDEWPLVKDLCVHSHLHEEELSSLLAKSYCSHVVHCFSTGSFDEPGKLSPNDYSEKFIEFANLCSSPDLVAKFLHKQACVNSELTILDIRINYLLHASLCTDDLDEISEQLDSCSTEFISDSYTNLIIDIAKYFPDPYLLPRFYSNILSIKMYNRLPHAELSKNVGKMIINMSRSMKSYNAESFLDLALQYGLHRDHADLRVDCGDYYINRGMTSENLQTASEHFLYALTFYLHENCYSLSIECLKKLSLISLQLDEIDTNPAFINLFAISEDKKAILDLMRTREFPCALTLAVAYDMDDDQTWSSVLYEQFIKKNNEEFITSFQCFKPLSTEICNKIVDEFVNDRAYDASKRERMEEFLKIIPNLIERYRLAKILKFEKQITQMKEKYPVVCEWCEKVVEKKLNVK